MSAIQRVFLTFSFLVVSILSSALLVLPCHSKEQKADRKYVFHLEPHDLKNYREHIKGYDIYDLDQWQNMDLDHISLETIIFHVAPVLGGCNCEMLIEPYHIYTPHSRSIELVKSGAELSHPIGAFEDDSRVQKDVILSREIMQGKDFFVGLYTHHERVDVLSAKTPEDIGKLTFVSEVTWEIDNQIIEKMGVNHVTADSWDSLINMIIAGRADVVMQPFHLGEDGSFIEPSSGERFVPIPHVKVPFPQDRAYFVSLKHPDGPEFLDALNRGLAVIDGDDGFLRKMIVKIGVIQDDKADYQILFPELVSGI